MKKIIINLFLTGLMFSCSSQEIKNHNSTDTQIYINGAIYTVNESQPWAEAMIVEDGIIRYVGSTIEAQKHITSSTSIIDLKKQMILPGLHDVHMHPMEVGATYNHFVLSEEEINAENYIPKIKKASQNHTSETWLIGFGHSINTLLNANRSPLEIIDEAVSDRPVIIMEQTSHSMWVNSKALELANITTSTSNPQGGIILKNQDGTLTGMLIDNAGDIVMQQAISSLKNASQGEYEGMIEYVLPELAKNGLTSISDARCYWKRGQHKAWKKLADEGKLTARFNIGLWAYPTEDDLTQLTDLKSFFSNDSTSLLKFNQIKLYSDGITHNTTAALHSNYLVDYFGLTTNNGLNYFTQDRITKYIQELEPIGFDFHIHAIGNRGVTEALNAIEKGTSHKGRHRLTHIEMIDHNDLARFKSLNVTADAQVAGDFTQPEFWHDNDILIGSTLANNEIPLKSLYEANARITLSSDWNVSDLNPFIGIQNAVTRTPQNISLKEAIKAYTINSAYVMRQEDKVGSLEIGKEADFIIINQNLFKIPPHHISKTKVKATYLKGQKIY
ncbi:exoenzyme regulatory protein AepA [Flavobacteriaceae bacterium UJ101]|nr:exoenzyme regulatory protein AepA [Flavobacteriaceae bacterium UJ101]